MPKVKLMRFELVALLDESRKLVDYLQRLGAVQIENVELESLTKYETGGIISQFSRYYDKAMKTVGILEEYCEIKKSFIESFSDYSVIEYNEYRQLCDKVDEIMGFCNEICRLSDEIDEMKADIVKKRTLIEYYRPWEKLDIPMSSSRTAQTSIFIGTFKNELTEREVKELLAAEIPETDGYDVQIISSDRLQTCALIICHNSDASNVEEALRKNGFSRPDFPAKKTPKSVIAEYEKDILRLEEKINTLKYEIRDYSGKYNDIRFLSDYYVAQKEKYETISLAGTTSRTIFFEGYVPEIKSEELKFEIERRFCAQLELYEPDYDNYDVPVLLENNSFAGGVESISNMYAAPLNDDVDPNPIMSFFYYGLFGLMLSDAGYGLLMVIFALVAKYKVKVIGNMRKTADFVFYCGISTIIWGALFGSWFGDLIPTLCTKFFGMENGPNLVIWFDPKEDSMKLLLYSFLFGIIHLFVGLAIRFYNLCRHHDVFGAICDVIPVYVFVTGFAIIGKNFIEPVSEKVRSAGYILLLVGAILIVLTAGRSAKNIFGKLGGGLYGLYNTTTGYMSDILSYSRLLALNLVTGVIAMVVNLLAAMPHNIIIFVLIFIIGHSINLAINLIGTYVHTSRLQYVEFFSKFYEGGGRSFTPFRINSKFFKLKEETINE